MASLNITPRYLEIKIGKDKGYFIIFKDNTGLIYHTDTITSLAQTNPKKFIKNKELVPQYRLFWIDSVEGEDINDALVLTVDPNGNLCERDVDPLHDAKATALVFNQLTKLNQMQGYFSEDDISILATKAIMITEDVTPEIAKGNAQRLLSSLDRRDKVITSALFNLEVNPQLMAAMNDDWSDQVVTIDVDGKEVAEDKEDPTVDLDKIEESTIEGVIKDSIETKKDLKVKEAK